MAAILLTDFADDPDKMRETMEAAVGPQAID
jgi:hypothetical protein